MVITLCSTATYSINHIKSLKLWAHQLKQRKERRHSIVRETTAVRRKAIPVKPMTWMNLMMTVTNSWKAMMKTNSMQQITANAGKQKKPMAILPPMNAGKLELPAEGGLLLWIKKNKE